ncbi:MAG TPA: FKBP-type peptidyl-prolyl cis-trans isomerase [Rhodothermales bacterium]|nr:FKBP-type peptidyl-prolyl cis-trans isomerase [Rhodothermales bacterium]
MLNKAVFLLLLAPMLLWMGCDSADDRPEVMIVELVIGEGDEAVEGARVTVHYVGKFLNGHVFDASLAEFTERLDEDTPFTFTLGRNNVIPGWEQGIPGMRVGGKRQLLIPPELAYGSRGAGCPSTGEDEECAIPPNTTLIFDVELLSVQLPSTNN